MSRLTRTTAELDAAHSFRTPPIKICPCPAEHGHEWRCDIDRGPGYHGIGATPEEALRNAAIAWQRYESERSTVADAAGAALP